MRPTIKLDTIRAKDLKINDIIHKNHGGKDRFHRALSVTIKGVRVVVEVNNGALTFDEYELVQIQVEARQIQ